LIRAWLACERRLGLALRQVAIAVTAVAAACSTPMSRGAESGQEQSGDSRVETSTAGKQSVAGPSTKQGTPTEGASVTPAGPKASLSGRQLYERMLHASALILARHSTNLRSWGTAWLVDRPGRLLVTSQHVLSPWIVGVPFSEPVRVYFPQSRDGKLITDPRQVVDKVRSYQGQVVDLDPGRDLAVLQVDGLPSEMEPLALSPVACAPGEAVHSLGNAIGEALWTYTSGTVRQVYQREVNEGGLPTWRYQCVETQEPINKGDSGGPVVNDEGQLIAVNHSMAAPGAVGVGTLTTFAVDVSEVKAFLEEVRPMLHPVTADDFYRRGLRHVSRGRAAPALSDFDEALKQLPRDRDPAAILISRAQAESYADDNREAVANLTRALSTRPCDPEVLVCRGRALLKTDDAPSARADFERVLTLAGRTSVKEDLVAQAYLGRATMSFKDGDHAAYARDTTQATRSDPRYFQAHLCLAARLNGLGQLTDALDESNKALQIARGNLDPIKRLDILGQVHIAFRTRAHIYARMKRYDDALRDYGAAVYWRMRVPPYKDTATFLVAVGQEMQRVGRVDFPLRGKWLVNYARKLPKEMGAEHPTFRERLLYVENRTSGRLVVYFKYHTLGENNQWEWRPGGDLASSEWASWSVEPGEASLAAVQGEPIRADRIRYVVKNERNETVSDKYWSEDLVLVTAQGYQAETPEQYILQLD
jgi:S1-C subfamily serine protease